MELVNTFPRTRFDRAAAITQDNPKEGFTCAGALHALVADEEGARDHIIIAEVRDEGLMFDMCGRRCVLWC